MNQFLSRIASPRIKVKQKWAFSFYNCLSPLFKTFSWIFIKHCFCCMPGETHMETFSFALFCVFACNFFSDKLSFYTLFCIQYVNQWKSWMISITHFDIYIFTLIYFLMNNSFYISKWKCSLFCAFILFSLAIFSLSIKFDNNICCINKCLFSLS